MRTSHSIVLLAGLALSAPALANDTPAAKPNDKPATKQAAKTEPKATSGGSMLKRRAKAKADSHAKAETAHGETKASVAKHADDAGKGHDKADDKAAEKAADKAHDDAHAPSTPAQTKHNDAERDANAERQEGKHDDAVSHATAATVPADHSAAVADAAPEHAVPSHGHGHADHASHAPSAAETKAPTADEALAMLREGNARWVAGKSQSPNADAAARDEAAKGQKPFVSVLGCADSRVPLERLFDRGVGEIFAVRVAGNVAGDSETGTLEYGVGHLHTPLLVVMGHSKCGAVAAAASGAEVHGKVASLIAHVQPAVNRAKASNPNASGDELVALAVRENVWQSIADLLRESSAVREAVEAGKLTVVGAVYDIASGEVSFMGRHPWQTEVVAAGKLAQTTTMQTAASQATSPASAHTVELPHGHAALKETVATPAHAVATHEEPAQDDEHAESNDDHAEPAKHDDH